MEKQAFKDNNNKQEQEIRIETNTFNIIKITMSKCWLSIPQGK